MTDNTEVKTSKWTVEKVEKIQRIMLLCNPVSLDQPMSYDLEGHGMDSIGDMVEDPAPGPEEIAINNINKELLLDIMDKSLGPRDIKIIMLRFGFEGHAKTLEEVGRMFGVTRERIRQIEAKAIMKLRRYMKRHDMFKRDDWNVE